MPARIMNSVNMNNTNIVNSIDVFKDSATMNIILKELHWDEECILQIFIG